MTADERWEHASYSEDNAAVGTIDRRAWPLLSENTVGLWRLFSDVITGPSFDAARLLYPDAVLGIYAKHAAFQLHTQ